MGKKIKYEIAKSIDEENEFQQPNCYHGAVSTWGSLLISLPFEIQIKIVSFLPAEDVYSLGLCNKYWRDLCFSNWAWKLLSIQRWPLLSEFLTQKHPVEGYVIQVSSKDEWPPNIDEIQKDWKQFYYDRIWSTIPLVGLGCGTISSYHLTKKFPNDGCKRLADVGYSFIDVEWITFSAKATLTVMMIGVLYSIKFLKVPRKIIAEALRRRKIHNKKIVEMSRATELVYNALVPKKERGYTLTLEELVLGNRICKNADGRIKKEKRIRILKYYIPRCSSRRSYR